MKLWFGNIIHDDTRQLAGPAGRGYLRRNQFRGRECLESSCLLISWYNLLYQFLLSICLGEWDSPTWPSWTCRTWVICWITLNLHLNLIFVSWFKWRVLHIFVAISNSLLFKSSESMKLTEADVKQMRTNRMFSGYPVPDQSRSHTFWSAVVNSFLEEHQFEDIAHVLARTWFSFVTKQVPLWSFLTCGPMCSSKLGFNPTVLPSSAQGLSWIGRKPSCRRGLDGRIWN